MAAAKQLQGASIAVGQVANTAAGAAHLHCARQHGSCHKRQGPCEEQDQRVASRKQECAVAVVCVWLLHASAAALFQRGVLAQRQL